MKTTIIALVCTMAFISACENKPSAPKTESKTVESKPKAAEPVFGEAFLKACNSTSQENAATFTELKRGYRVDGETSCDDLLAATQRQDSFLILPNKPVDFQILATIPERLTSLTINVTASQSYSGINQLKTVRKVKLVSSGMAKLPADIVNITKMPNLSSLQIQKFESFPLKKFAPGNQIKGIHLLNSTLENPADLSKFPNVELINIMGKGSRNLTEAIGSLKKLSYLTIVVDGDDLSSFANLENLTTLNINGKFKSVDFLAKLNKLESVSLNKASIASNPKVFAAMKSLTNLSLRSNDLEKIPPLPDQLEKFSSSSNPIKNLPSALPAKLTQFRLYGHKITKSSDDCKNSKHELLQKFCSKLKK